MLRIISNFALKTETVWKHIIPLKNATIYFKELKMLIQELKITLKSDLQFCAMISTHNVSENE